MNLGFKKQRLVRYRLIHYFAVREKSYPKRVGLFFVGALPKISEGVKPMSMEIEDPRLITLSEEEAAPILGFTVATLRKRRWERKPPAFLKIGRKIRYRLSDLHEYLDACTVEPQR